MNIARKYAESLTRNIIILESSSQ